MLEGGSLFLLSNNNSSNNNNKSTDVRPPEPPVQLPTRRGSLALRALRFTLIWVSEPTSHGIHCPGGAWLYRHNKPSTKTRHRRNLKRSGRNKGSITATARIAPTTLLKKHCKHSWALATRNSNPDTPRRDPAQNDRRPVHTSLSRRGGRASPQRIASETSCMYSCACIVTGQAGTWH